MHLRKRIAEYIYPEFKAERRSYERLINIDDLTGLGNRRAWEKAKDTVEKDPNLVLILFDMNNFGIANKVHGHEEGDRLLKLFARILIETPGRPFRIGGDEFILVMDERRSEAVLRQVERAFPWYLIRKDNRNTIISVTGVIAKTFIEADSKLQGMKLRTKKSLEI